jgi:hypothetical protein
VGLEGLLMSSYVTDDDEIAEDRDRSQERGKGRKKKRKQRRGGHIPKTQTQEKIDLDIEKRAFDGARVRRERNRMGKGL